LRGADHECSEGLAAAARGDMGSQLANERKFGNWEDRPDGGRRYWYDVIGRNGWRARYVKEVDAFETTMRFVQEIYDPTGELTEVHQKYPVDLGHRRVD
jgi:hypothetical protein